jgi:thioredoxin reductase (NADPH)
MPASDSHQWYLPEKSREQLKTLFKELVSPVNLHVFTKTGANDLFNEFLSRFARDLAKLTDKIVPHERSLDAPLANTWGVTHSPTALIEPERFGIRFLGAPLGEEGRAFLAAILMASKGDSGLAPESRARLADLSQERTVKVFASPTCPYCPGQAVNAIRCAIERPDLVSAWCVEIGQMSGLASLYEVGSVPHTVYHETLTVLGLEPEARFVEELVTLEDAQARPMAPRRKPGETVEADCLILGAGPAGLTAGIYAGRAGLTALILEKGVIGGQVSVTPVVENYPGFVSVAGLTLTEIMAAQARQYCEIIQEEPARVTAGPDGVRAETATISVRAKALVIATGAVWRKLDVPGEAEFFGRGVNHCATCDGYLYRGKKALVIGGGNTALTDALYLKSLGVDVSIVHRRDEFRAERYLQDSVKREGIPLLMNRVTQAILGRDKANAVRLKDAATGKVEDVAADGVFVAIGETPNSEVAARLGCALDKAGHVVVDSGMRTSVPRVYAAGDVTGGVRQIVTAVGQGGAAALSLFEDLKKLSQ